MDADEPPILKTARLVLRPPEERDIPAWFARATDRESAQLAGDPVPESIAEGDAWLERARQNAATGKRFLWSIDVPGVADSIGTVGLSFDTPTVSFVIGRDYRRRGHATEAAREVLRYGVEYHGVSEVVADVVERNIASLRVLDKLGFEYAKSFVDESDGELCRLLVLRC